MAREYHRQSGPCSEPGCGLPAKVKGLCVPHYKQSNGYKAQNHARLLRNQALRPAETRWRSVVNAAASRCRRSGLPFTITLEYVLSLPQPIMCPVLPHIRIDYGFSGRKGCREDAPSLDRINDSLGYVPGNVRIISMRANRLKSDSTVEERELLAADARAPRLAVVPEAA